MDTGAIFVTLSHGLGAEHRQLAIRCEGNTSATMVGETFLVKASGSDLGHPDRNNMVERRFTPLLTMVDQNDLKDQQIEDELFGCRVDPRSKKPSVEKHCSMRTCFRCQASALSGMCIPSP